MDNYIKKITGTPLGKQCFENIPERRYLNKALFYRFYTKIIKTLIPFSLN